MVKTLSKPKKLESYYTLWSQGLKTVNPTEQVKEYILLKEYTTLYLTFVWLYPTDYPARLQKTEPASPSI